MLKMIDKYWNKPALYAPGTAKFWDDEHISKGMLEAHINPVLDSATRNHAFVQQSVEWITEIAPPQSHPTLLDLGCGPGIYAELFDDVGYQVTGIDLSERSINYAGKSAQTRNKSISYKSGDYLSMDYAGKFDLITLIYCDFGVLATEDRATLLERVYAALNPNGIFIFDVFTPFQYSGRNEYRRWEYEKTGFWSEVPYLCLSSFHRYDEHNTFLQQYLVITENEANCYNVWEHTFKKEELTADLNRAVLGIEGFYGDIAGCVCSPKGKQLCVVARKMPV